MIKWKTNPGIILLNSLDILFFLFLSFPFLSFPFLDRFPSVAQVDFKLRILLSAF